MLTKRTTLILGAGASIDFEFPSGWGLRVEILKMLGSHASHGTKAMDDLGYGRHDRESFADALTHSGTSSVDAFLATRADLVAIGKAAIAAALIPSEAPWRVRRLDRPQRWIDLLLVRMAASLSEWKRNQLAIVTFNYDRLMEFALHSAVKHSYKLSDEEAGDVLSEAVRIVHVHGQLGGYPHVQQYESLPTGPSRPFSQDVTADSVRFGASGIRILHEGEAGDAPFTKARELIAWAEEVVIFGFGYHRESMQRLDLKHSLRGKTVLGSCVGMTNLERENATQFTNGSLVLEIGCNPLADLMRNYSIFGH